MKHAFVVLTLLVSSLSAFADADCNREILRAYGYVSIDLQKALIQTKLDASVDDLTIALGTLRLVENDLAYRVSQFKLCSSGAEYKKSALDKTVIDDMTEYYKLELKKRQ